MAHRAECRLEMSLLCLQAKRTEAESNMGHCNWPPWLGIRSSIPLRDRWSIYLFCVCSHFPLPPSLSPSFLSLVFLPDCPLYFEALCAERGVCLQYPVLQCPSLDGSIFVLCLGQQVYRQNPAMFEMIVIYPENRRLEHIVFEPLSYKPKFKPSLLIT